MLHLHLQFRTPTLRVAAAPKPIDFNLIRCSISGSNPARDRVVDFGKYRGKMLGALPSPYLQWISKNLRTGDTEQWARLADQVLEDPVYRDRVEWEFAEKVLNGDVLTTLSTTSSSASSVDALLEISERFGWDNEDKIGWSKVKFELLGTSRGGRIPRVSDKAASLRKVGETARRRAKEDGDRGRRREARRAKRVEGNLGNESDTGGGDGGASGGRTEVEIHNRFPGRESLLRKAMLGRSRDT